MVGPKPIPDYKISKSVQGPLAPDDSYIFSLLMTLPKETIDHYDVDKSFILCLWCL